MASATRGGAPGYDDDKEFGNNIAHLPAQTSQRLRGYSQLTPIVKASCHSRRFGTRLAGFRPFGEGEIAAMPQKRSAWQRLCRDCHRPSPGAMAIQPPPRRLRRHPFELRQLMPKPGELPLGVVPGVGCGRSRRPPPASSRRAMCRISAGTPWAFIAGSSGSSCRAASAATSSSAPPASIASNRASIRA